APARGLTASGPRTGWCPMLRLALVGGPDDAERYARVAPRVRGARLTAVVGRDARDARRAALALDAGVWSDDFGALLSAHVADFDAVIICRPGRSHAPLCRHAAAAGKHVLLE